MQQQGDYNASSSSYYQFPHSQNPNPNPNPIPNPSDSLQNQFASAPPFTSDYAPYASNYPPYPQNPDPISPSPTAPSYSPTPNPNLNSFSSNPQPSSFPPFESHIPYQPPSQQQCQYPPYDQHPTTSNYASNSSPAVPPNPTPNSSYPPVYLAASSASYTHPGSFVPPAYESPYESSVKFDYGAAYVDDKYRSFDRSRSDLGSDLYAKRPDSGTLRYGTGRDEMYGDGVYAYDGGKVEPYGARGTAPKSSAWPVFDDYGRSISLSSPKESSYTATKVVKAVPKTDTNEDVKSGVQKFRVKLLAESGGQSTMDVLCQV